MPKTTKPMTTQRLHAVLKKAGHKPSRVTGASRVRGMPNRTLGYVLAKGPDSIRVHYRGSDYLTPDEHKWRALEGIRESLEAAGIACRIEGCGVVVPTGEGATMTQGIKPSDHYRRLIRNLVRQRAKDDATAELLAAARESLADVPERSPVRKRLVAAIGRVEEVMP